MAWNQSKFKVQEALEWIPPELRMLKSNELLPIQEDIQMATTCAARIAALEVKDLKSRSIPSSFGMDPKSGEAFSFGSHGQDASADLIKQAEAEKQAADKTAAEKELHAALHLPLDTADEGASIDVPRLDRASAVARLHGVNADLFEQAESAISELLSAESAASEFASRELSC